MKDRHSIQALLGLFGLGLLGGGLFELGDKFIRIWANDLGMSLNRLDVLSGIELLHPLKFLWMPLLASSISFGPWRQRRLWVLIALLVCVVCVGIMSGVPFWGGSFVLILAVLTVARASYDALVVAAQMQGVGRSLWGWSENMCVLGYRLGMTLAMALGMRASTRGVTWPTIYIASAGIVLVGLVWIARSPRLSFLDTDLPQQGRVGVVSALWQWFAQPGSGWVVALLLIYRAQDGLIHPQQDIFLLQHGLNKVALSNIKMISMIANVAGGALTAIIIRRQGYKMALLTGLLSHALSAWLWWTVSMGWFAVSGLAGTFYVVEQFTTGLSMIALYSFQLVCCRGAQVMTQIALWSALSDFGMRLFSLRSGWIVVHWGWPWLMALGGMVCIPIIGIIIRSFPTPENKVPPQSP
jgi:PAT family beta-lactamase induction signal transducer AmpG